VGDTNDTQLEDYFVKICIW